MIENNFHNGHPRTRGARAIAKNELNIDGEFPLKFGVVPSFDGNPIFYCEEGSGPALVFCYGIACSTLHWTYQIDYFRKNYRCIWFDYRGHRHTALPANLASMTVNSCARDLKAVLDFIEVDQAVLLGHSMGVSVVLEFARLYSSRVSKLVLANGTPKRPLDTLLGGNYFAPAFGLFSKMQKNSPQFVKNIWGFQEKIALIPYFLGAVGFNRSLSSREDIETYAKQIAELAPSVLTYMMDDYQNFDATPWLHEIVQRTLVISGDSDYVTPPSMQELMMQLLPNAELARVAHGSHCCTLDMPDYVNLLIERFVSS